MCDSYTHDMRSEKCLPNINKIYRGSNFISRNPELNQNSV